MGDLMMKTPVVGLENQELVQSLTIGVEGDCLLPGIAMESLDSEVATLLGDVGAVFPLLCEDSILLVNT
jgi:hypothetical protein